MLEEEIRKNRRAEDITRMDLLRKRFDFRRGSYTDYFLQAVMALKQYDSPSGRHADAGRLFDDLMQYTDDLCVRERPVSEALEKEWENLAAVWIESCLASKNYTSGPFGLGRLSEEKIARKIAYDIDFVTRILPMAADMQEEYLPLRECMVRVYCRTLRNGNLHWMEYEDSIG